MIRWKVYEILEKTGTFPISLLGEWKAESLIFPGLRERAFPFYKQIFLLSLLQRKSGKLQFWK